MKVVKCPATNEMLGSSRPGLIDQEPLSLIDVISAG